MRFRCLLLLGIVVAVLAGCAGPTGTSKPAIKNAWGRPGSAGQNGAIYFMIDNSGGAADQLVGAASPVAKTVELHRSMMEGDMMKMVPQPVVEIPAGKSVEFKPGDYHVMLVGLTRDLKFGENFEFTLKFAKAGEITLTAKVSE